MSLKAQPQKDEGGEERRVKESQRQAGTIEKEVERCNREVGVDGQNCNWALPRANPSEAGIGHDGI